MTLAGTAADLDGDALAFSRTHNGTLPIELADDAAPSTTFEAPDVDADTTMAFTLTVTDGTVHVAAAVPVTIADSQVLPDAAPICRDGVVGAPHCGDGIAPNRYMDAWPGGWTAYGAGWEGGPGPCTPGTGPAW